MRALIVDDEYYARKALYACISNAFHHADFHDVVLFECEDAETALKVLEHSNVDIIFTDIKMHQMSGIELCEYARNKYPDIFLVIISGYADFEFAQKAIENRVFRYLLKPVDENDIGEVIKDFTSYILIKDQVRKHDSEHDKPASADTPVVHDLFIRKIDNLTKRLINYYLAEKQIVLLDDLVKQYFKKQLSSNELTDDNAYLYYNEVLDAIKSAIADNEDYNAILPDCSLVSRNECPTLNACVLNFNSIIRLLNDAAENSTSQKQTVKQLIDYINEHYGEDLSLYDIAEKVFYIHPNYLSKLLKMETGMTFSRYLTFIRMDKAKQMLCDSTLSISAISGFVGYNSPSYFVQTFHRMMGMTPNEFRKKNGIEPENDESI